MYARSEENESILLFRMIRVSYKSAKLIGKCSFGLIERDAMLLTVCRLLTLIPFEDKMTHKLHCRYYVITVKRKSWLSAAQKRKRRPPGPPDANHSIRQENPIPIPNLSRLKGTKPKSTSNPRNLTTDHGPGLRTPDHHGSTSPPPSGRSADTWPQPCRRRLRR